MNKPTGKLAFAYETIGNMESKIETYKSRIAELEGQLADKSKLSLPAEELKELIYSIHGSHHVGDAQHTKLDIINAQIDSLYASREPFVVKMPLSISVLISDGLHADFMLNSEIKAAITAAGGRCV